MRAPEFWYEPPDRPSWQTTLLAPLGAVYARATARRIAAGPGAGVGAPVICVGNLNAGGTGKTPAVIALIECLAARGVAAHVVSRGHGGSLAGPVLVDPARHRAGETGDEPLLIAAFGPTWVAKDRAAGAAAAVRAGARAILLDDGFQDPALARALSVVVVDAARGFGNGRCIPAGPLREPVAAGLARADLLLSVGAAEAQAAFARVWGASVRLPRTTAVLRPLATGMDWAGVRVLAFAGIGDPARFFASLGHAGADVVRTVALDDHQPLTPALFARLEAEAASCAAQLVTTEKDAVRLEPGDRARVLAFPVRLSFDDPGLIADALTRIGL